MTFCLLSWMFLAAQLTANAQDFPVLGPPPVSATVARQQIRTLLEKASPDNHQQTINTLLNLVKWYRSLLDEELIAAWQRDGRANLTDLMGPLADARVASAVVEFSWRQRRDAAFTPAYAPMLGDLMTRYPESADTFLEDLLESTAAGQPGLKLSAPQAEAVCRILLDMPDIRSWKKSALQILPHYRREAQKLLEEDLQGSDKEKMYRASRWMADLGAPAPAPGSRRSAAPAPKPSPAPAPAGVRDNQSAPCVAVPAGLVGWWTGDHDENDIAGGNNASAVNAVSLVPGEVGTGFSFGTRGGIHIPNTVDLRNQQFTWMAWARPDGPGPNNDQNGSVIVAQSDGHAASANLQWRATDNRFLFFFGDIASERIESTHTFMPGAFYLVAGTYDGQTFRLFVNGAIEGSVAKAKAVTYANSPWKFGSTGVQCGASCRTWNGVIDEVQAYNRALSVTEILAIFNAGSAGVCKDAVPAKRDTAAVAPGGANPTRIYRAGNGVAPPIIAHKVDPDYSEVARKLGAYGIVMLAIVIEPDGVAQNIKVVKSLGYGLDEKAMEAVRKWRFQPAKKDGVAVAVEATVEVNFRLLGPNAGHSGWSPSPISFAADPGVTLPVVRDGTMPKPDTDLSDATVILTFTVDAKGAVKNIRPFSGPQEASDVLSPYLATWKFHPALKGSQPVEAKGSVTFVKGKGGGVAKPAVPTLPAATLPGAYSSELQPAPEYSAPKADAGQIRNIGNTKDGQRYVWIPAGGFTMGCSPGDTECGPNEKPAHAERVANGFWLGQTEVTQAAYARVSGGNPSVHKGGQLPVESVTWNEAANYCAAIGGRLPTETEWEYAARAGSKEARYGSLDDIAWYLGNSGNANQAVARKQPNAFGLYDMLGNMWEWVEDSYGNTGSKVVRGGARSADSRFARASLRINVEPTRRNDDKGFRCAAEWPATAESAPPGAPDTMGATANSGAGPHDAMLNPKDGQRYAWIPPGAFTMGCSPGDTECLDNEKPAHAERIANGFWLGQTEVTQVAYRQVTGSNPSQNKGDQLPVESVSWSDAANYCAAIGGRLPTESEWEYAARAGSKESRYGSMDAVAWHNGNGGGKTHPVALKQPNAFGLYDMLGNVWEWVEGTYAGTSQKILRGGSLFVDSRSTRVSCRFAVQPPGSAIGRGFRCAIDAGGDQAPADVETVKLGDAGVTAPQIVRKTDPEYSEAARAARVQGVVVLRIVIDEEGDVTNPVVVRGLGLGLTEKAIECVRQWKFQAATKDGRPVAMTTTVEVNFRML
jgi:TonB family protein